MGGRKGVQGFSAARLREHRTRAGLTQEQLAELVGTRRPNVVAWESGRRVPQADTLAAIASVLGVASLAFTDAGGHLEGLARLRVLAGLTQAQLADAAQIGRSTYSALERGESASLGVERARALARVFKARKAVTRIADVEAAHRESRAAFARRARGTT